MTTDPPSPSVPTAPPGSPAAPWWERLDLDAAFDFRPRPSAPASGGSIGSAAVSLSGAFETFTRGGLGVLLSAASASTLTAARTDPDGLRRRWAPLADADADRWFATPATPTAQIARARFAPGAPAGTIAYDVAFPSTYEPADAAYPSPARNSTVHARWFRHRESERDVRPVIVVLHGFQIGRHVVNTVYFEVSHLSSLGFDVVLMQLPFHGNRAGPVEGFEYLGLDLSRMADAVAHSIHDARALLSMLADEGVPAVGVTGVSLGGYLSALLAGVDDRPAFAIPVAPAVSLVDTVAGVPPADSAFAWLLARTAMTLEDARRGAALHTPLSHPPKIAHDRLFIVGAVDDRITEPWQQHLLWQHWGEPAIFWHAGSHQVHLTRRAFRDRLRRFVESTGVLAD
jgi:dienelactone hydrolase